MIQSLRVLLTQLRKDERGVTTVEYAVMIGLVALAVALSVPGISDAVVAMFEAIAAAINGLLTP